MEFKSSRTLALAVGVPTGLGGVIATLMAVMMPAGHSPGMLLFAGPILVLVAMFVLSTRVVVRIDRSTGSIVRTVHLPLWTYEKSHDLSKFSGVGIVSGTAVIPLPRYGVRLVGTSAIRLPGIGGKIESARFEARRISKYAGLPCESRVETASAA
jgi:hypothetical protein